MVEEPGWPCPCEDCGGLLGNRLKKDGRNKCVHSTNQVYKDPSTCQFTCSSFVPTRRTPINYYMVCREDVGGSPSIGEPTKEKDARCYFGELSTLPFQHERDALPLLLVLLYGRY